MARFFGCFLARTMCSCLCFLGQRLRGEHGGKAEQRELCRRCERPQASSRPPRRVPERGPPFPGSALRFRLLLPPGDEAPRAADLALADFPYVFFFFFNFFWRGGWDPCLEGPVSVLFQRRLTFFLGGKPLCVTKQTPLTRCEGSVSGSFRFKNVRRRLPQFCCLKEF